MFKSHSGGGDCGDRGTCSSPSLLAALADSTETFCEALHRTSTQTRAPPSCIIDRWGYVLWGYLELMRGRATEDNRAVRLTFSGGAGESVVSASNLSPACCIAERCLLCGRLDTPVSARRRQGPRTLFDYLWQECGTGNTIPHAAGLTRGDCNICSPRATLPHLLRLSFLQPAAVIGVLTTTFL